MDEPMVEIPSGFDGIHDFPLYHDGAIGSLSSLGDAARYLLMASDIDLACVISADDKAFLTAIGARLVLIVPPDGDGHRGYCDLDMAYSAYFADHRSLAVFLRPDGTLLGSAADLDEIAALVERIRGEIGIAETREKLGSSS